MRLREEHQGGFERYCDMEGQANKRMTVRQWDELLASHWTRKIK
jgi:hypothetical protein